MSTANNEKPGRSYQLPFLLFLAIGAYFLWTEHRAHVIEYLPFVFLFACVGIHFFMHGSHGGHGGHSRQQHEENTDESKLSPITNETASEESETKRSK